jgi:uncharacterized metal-binding protein
MTAKACACGTAPKLIFPCSGSSDVGAIADQAARKMTRDGTGRMYCLAGIGGRVSGIMKSTEAAGRILVLDGCPQECAAKTLRLAGFNTFEHIRLSDLGLAKGATPPTPEVIAKVAEAGAGKLTC